MPKAARIALVLLSVALAIILIIRAAKAEDKATWFKSLKQPDTGLSCCDISDCHPTKAEYRKGAWWAVVAGKWRQVPANKVLNKTSILEDAVICTSDASQYTPGEGYRQVEEPKIYCFIPQPMSF